MSHVTSSLAVITDLGVLRAVIENKFPHLQWMEGQTSYIWFGEFLNDWHTDQAAHKRGIQPHQYGKCDHALKLPGCQYEIGITKREDTEGWSLVWDVWKGSAISQYIGQDAEELMTEYNRAYCEKYGYQEGCMVETVEENDRIVIRLITP